MYGAAARSVTVPMLNPNNTREHIAMAQNDSNLHPEAIIEAASQRTGGLNDLGEPPFELFFKEGLERVLTSLQEQGRLNDIGRLIASERMIGHTVNRLQFVNDRKRFPAIADESIVKPVFIIGMPRTGTTILHDILGQDPASRVPMTWECMFPSPPPERETFRTDPRIAQCQATFPDVEQMIPEFKAMHPMGAELSQECVTLFGDSMCTALFHNQFRVPGYQDWVDRTDLAPVYAFHKRQLQHFQWRCPGERWVLKTGAHMWGLEHLLTTYPDARIVFTHRDPVKSMTSYASLTALVRTMGSDEVDKFEIAQDWITRLSRVVQHALDVREGQIGADAKGYDMFFTDFVNDQFAEVERIYEALDIELTGEAADSMRAFIDDNPQDKHGRHTYSESDFGIDPGDVREQFKRYIQHFDLKPE